MNNEHLIQQARGVFLHLRKEEKKNINPYASFADQMIALINNGQVVSRADVLRFTRMSYPRPRMNRQWQIFGKVLEKDLQTVKEETLLYFFGYLKRILTIEGKREMEENKRVDQDKSEYSRDNRRDRGRWGKRK